MPMQPFENFSSVVVPLDRANVDTDAIIPKQFLKSIQRTGFGPYLFDEWRYLDHGEPGMDCTNRPINPDFVLNDPRYQGAKILLARRNFGCGSSREHAPWALADYGFRVLIAPSFADIFHQNATKNGILPVVLDEALIDELFTLASGDAPLTIDVDLHNLKLSPDGRAHIEIDIDPHHHHCLIHGLDDIGLTLEHADAIAAYEQRRATEAPWLFA
ncbi:3-isopropylmalate dehydratase, small subunit [Thiorhodovibrio frisius]|uniref:3-isopropylmalate dehydratase small subunit n=2 Tax=Thiorhodovibrio frisius TaxID=631362 RepID=H8YYK7_9GAMM|nr:3-isopropylmalate dehydratase, small subunit [Thiorhodovibrio frisius]WPL23380.1 3-isopropylmalate dehydratase small subunit [Thiorhodovibrio frisius]